MTLTVAAWELEYHDPSANSHKFYRVFLVNNVGWSNQWGRIGAAGQWQFHSDGRSSLSNAQEKVFSKTGEGYSIIKKASYSCVDDTPKNLLAGFAAAPNTMTAPKTPIKKAPILKPKAAAPLGGPSDKDIKNTLMEMLKTAGRIK